MQPKISDKTIKLFVKCFVFDFVSTDTTLCFDFEFDCAVSLCLTLCYKFVFDFMFRPCVNFFISTKSTLCFDFVFEFMLRLCVRLCVRLYVSTLCSNLCFDFVFEFVFGFMFRLCLRLYVSTELNLCFDFEFDYKAFSTMDFLSNSDMCSTRLGQNINRKPRPGTAQQL